MKKIILLCIFNMGLIVCAQDSRFFQFQSNPLNLNPALAGTDGSLRVISSTQIQRYGLNNDHSFYVFSAASVDHYLHAVRGGLGLLYVNENDRYGQGSFFSSNRMSLSYSPSIPVFHHKAVFKPGIEFAYQKRVVDYSIFDVNRGFVFPEHVERNHFGDFSMGMSIYAKYFLMGIAVHHINEPALEYSYQLPVRYTFHGSGIIPLWKGIKDTLFISPSICFTKQQDYTQFASNLMFKYSYYSAGLGYSSGRVVFHLGFVHKYFKLMYSYRGSFYDINDFKYGPHEISLSAFLFSNKRKTDRLFWKRDL